MHSVAHGVASWLCCLACGPVLGERTEDIENRLQPLPIPLGELGEQLDSSSAGGLIANSEHLSEEYNIYLKSLKRPAVYAGQLTSQCDKIVNIDSMSLASRSCPTKCRWLAEVRHASTGKNISLRKYKGEDTSCRFQCVSSTGCGTKGLDPESKVADIDDYVCRHCSVAGCLQCAPGHDDKCDRDKCASGYYWDKFSCIEKGRNAFRVFFSVVGGLTFVLLVWYLDLLLLRPAVNVSGMLHGLRFRMRTKLRQPKVEPIDGSEATESSASVRSLYPLTTNLQRSDNANIAGAGTVLHFNFLLASTVWPACIALLWLIFVKCSTNLLFIVGTIPATTPAQLCAAINWGYSAQRSYMSVKVWFLLATYIFTFVGSIVYSAVQLRRFHRMNAEATTMQDFACLVEGLDLTDGKASAEEDTRLLLEKLTGQSLIGVSLCWNYLVHEEELLGICHQDVDRQVMKIDSLSTSEAGSSSPAVVPTFFMRRPLKYIDALFGFVMEEIGNVRRQEERPVNLDYDDVPPDNAIKDLLGSLRTTGSALAVFRNEACRDAAVKASKASGGFVQEGGSNARRVKIRTLDLEPDTIHWQNFGYSKDEHLMRLLFGILVMLLTLVAWAVFFYLPYTYYILAFSYAHGEEPSTAHAMVFTLLVVAGNQIIYFVSMSVAVKIGYVSNDHKEACYSVLYTAANIINVVVDLAITSYCSYQKMLGKGVYLSGGVPLGALDSLHDIMEAYPMQRSMGYQIWLYNFPSTFLVPYVMEPIFAIVIPRHLMMLLVRSTLNCEGTEAEKALAIFSPMDIGRYADVIVNVTLAVMVFFFPSGYTLQMFVALALCHLYIYWYDHYRVLRCVPAFWYSNYVNESFSQALLSFPCALILAALLFKANCLGKEDLRWGEEDSDTITCVRDTRLYMLVGGGFALHIALHLFVLLKVLPSCIHKEYKPREEDYPSVAARLPGSWFNSNPVHCLRSKYIHNHHPPCYYHIQGKEHALKVNPEIHCYFEEGVLAGGYE
eukprot:TRINITY_DN26834_c0_g1_i1.p1 TRINITY_DN26834_c0_g1~~TRINITY_DN26834_c0_g1_i1.p1  ORF type:complete len:1005 (+),score=127.81 TRINITY_DN26834_c0_g1_i1:124-3138(+)